MIRPCVTSVAPEIDLSVPSVTTVVAERTFWDKVVILHGHRQWFERRGKLRGDGHRASRHYYDLYRLLGSKTGRKAELDTALAADCVQHAQMFFNSSDLNLALAVRGFFTLSPNGDMADLLGRDYDAMSAMIFGERPSLGDILERIGSFEDRLNAARCEGRPLQPMPERQL